MGSMRYLFKTLVSFGVVVLLSTCGQTGTRVKIDNQHSAPMKNVVVQFTGGQQELGTVAPNSTAETYINPTGESALDVAYQLGEGTPKKDKIDIYLEPGYGGEIVIFLSQDGKLTWKDHTKAGVY